MKGKTKLLTATITLPDGKRKYFRAATQDALDEKVARAERDLGLGIRIDDNTTVGELAQLWYDTCKAPRLRPSSAASLRYTVNNYVLDSFLTEMLVRDVRPVHIMQRMNQLSSYSRSIQSKALQVLTGIFRFAVDNNLIARSPVVSTIKASGERAKEKVPLTPAQSAQLLSTLEGTRAHLPVAIMLGAGLRREEVLGLMWNDIDLEAGMLNVRHAKPLTHGVDEVTEHLKTKAAYRTIPLTYALMDELKTVRAKSNSVYVIAMRNGQALSESSWKSLWGAVTSRTTDDPALLGQPVDAKHPQVRYGIDFYCHPHLLRHTCITRWFEAGLDLKEIQYLAGHSTTDMSMSVYTHYDRIAREADTAQKIRAIG